MRRSDVGAHQRALFKEQARWIVAEDRYARKAGRSQNTIGEIERALVRAYLLGAQLQVEGDAQPVGRPDPAFVEWVQIPPRARHALWTVTVSVGHAHREDVEPHVVLRKDGGVRLHWHWVGHREPTSFSDGAIAPLVRLGLLAVDEKDRDLVALTERGLHTSREYWRRWNARDPTLPVMSIRP